MRILFTGASSFSGMWFVREFLDAGHAVTICLRRPREQYEGLRLSRIEQLLPHCSSHFSCNFGSDSFLNLVHSSSWDLFCHHAADVSQYKSPDFDVAAALANNTHNLKKVLQAFQSRGCNRVLLTGSVFEQNEGAGSDQLRAVSPYGLSKGLTTEMFRYFASILGMKLGKFVIPNPFGPFEEPRYTSFLAKSWFEGSTPKVQTPDYVRDNVPIALLAEAYGAFAHRLSSQSGFEKYNPSCYAESQGAFTERFAKEMRSRLKLPCAFELNQQTDFSEPKVRVNTEPLQTSQGKENKAWDALAAYYQQVYRK